MLQHVDPATRNGLYFYPIACSASVSYILTWRVRFARIFDTKIVWCFVYNQLLYRNNTHLYWAFQSIYSAFIKPNKIVTFLDESESRKCREDVKS
jgi:hypothetical protein